MKISSVVLVAVLAFSFAAVTIHARSAPGATDSADKALPIKTGRHLLQLDPNAIQQFIESIFTFVIPKVNWDASTSTFSISNSADFGNTNWFASSNITLPNPAPGGATFGATGFVNGSTGGLFGDTSSILYKGATTGYVGGNTINGTYGFTDKTELGVTNTTGITQAGGLKGTGDLNSVQFSANGGTTVQTMGETGKPMTLPIDVNIGPLNTPGSVPTTIFSGAQP